MSERKSQPPSPEEMIAQLDGLTLFAAQQAVNGWFRAYGPEAVRKAQAEVDRRRAKQRSGQ